MVEDPMTRRHRTPARSGRERGAAAVEFALVLPVLLLLVLGAIDWGWYFYLREVVTNAAREGARVGSVHQDGQAAATTYLTNLGLTRGGAVSNVVTVNGIDTVLVTVTYPAGSLTGFIPVVPATITAQAQMRLEGP
jgi:Flp pilus assembly protein TadG